MTYQQWETELRDNLVNHNAIWCAAKTPEMRKLMLEYWWNYERSAVWTANRLNTRWNNRIEKLKARIDNW